MATGGAGTVGEIDCMLEPSLLELELVNGRLIRLGSGTSGTVYKAHYNGVPVAAKEVLITSSVTPEKFQGEVKVHKDLKDEHVVEMLGAVVKEHDGQHEYYAILERCDGCLRRLVLTDTGILHDASCAQRMRWLLEIAKALRYMHERLVIHADLKPENVLLKFGASGPEDAKVKVGDFGLSRIQRSSAVAFRATAYGEKGTYIYMDPCLWDPLCRIARSSDIYSFGILTWELLTGLFPFQDVTTSTAWMSSLKDAVCGGEGRLPLRPDLTPLCAALPPQFQGSVMALVTACWAPNREDRPPASRLVEQLETIYSYFPESRAKPTRSATSNAREAVAPSAVREEPVPPRHVGVAAPAPTGAGPAPASEPVRVVQPARALRFAVEALPDPELAAVEQLRALIAQSQGVRRVIDNAAAMMRRTPTAHLTIKLDRYDHGPEVSFRNETRNDSRQFVSCFSPLKPGHPYAVGEIYSQPQGSNMVISEVDLHRVVSIAQLIQQHCTTPEAAADMLLRVL